MTMEKKINEGDVNTFLKGIKRTFNDTSRNIVVWTGRLKQSMENRYSKIQKNVDENHMLTDYFHF